MIGGGGQMIKSISKASSLEIESLIGKKVTLDLNVKVREKWMQNPNLLKEIGFLRN